MLENLLSNPWFVATAVLIIYIIITQHKFDLPTIDEIYLYGDKEYRFDCIIKCKIDGVWQKIVIYEALYEHEDGPFFARPAKEFFKKFEKVE